MKPPHEDGPRSQDGVSNVVGQSQPSTFRVPIRDTLFSAFQIALQRIRADHVASREASTLPPRLESQQPAAGRTSLQSLLNQAIQTINEAESSNSELAESDGSHDGVGDDESKEDIPGDELEGMDAGDDGWEQGRERFEG